MTGFSIKIPETLNDALEAHLRATGKTRSAFVRELIERELGVAEHKQAELRSRVMALAGILGREGEITSAQRPGKASSRDTNRILLDEGYGLDNAKLGHR